MAGEMTGVPSRLWKTPRDDTLCTTRRSTSRWLTGALNTARMVDIDMGVRAALWEHIGRYDLLDFLRLSCHSHLIHFMTLSSWPWITVTMASFVLLGVLNFDLDRMESNQSIHS